MIHPYKLWSLWDMLQIFADEYMNIGGTMAYIQVHLHNCVSKGKGIDADFCQQFKDTLILLKASCDKVNLKVSADLLEKAINDLPQSERELELIIRAIKSEIKSNLFLWLDEHSYCCQDPERTHCFNRIEATSESREEGE